MTLSGFVDQRDIQHELFGRLSDMFAREVPMYDRSLGINSACNRAAADVLAGVFPGLCVSDEQIEQTSGERHGAIRIGREDEFRWVGRFFACFDMYPHNFYDMTSIGSKSQPVIATAFRSTCNPDHRVFASLLRTAFFAPRVRDRIESLLGRREVFTARARALIGRHERDGGLNRADADALIDEATSHIFRFKPVARDPGLYRELCDSGYKIAADIACFTTHHLNHLTPNTLCMDLYTAAMRLGLGEIDADRFVERARRALLAMTVWMDRPMLGLHFKHLDADEIDRLGHGEVPEGMIRERVEALRDLLVREHDLSGLKHNGFKDYTEGPSAEAPVLLRQDAYRALTEPVEFAGADNSTETINHTARFGEIEQRFYATTPDGRELYDRCLASLSDLLGEDPRLPARDPDGFEERRRDAFAPIPSSLDGLLERGLVHGLYEPTPAGLARAGTIGNADLRVLVAQGFVRVRGLRYEDFLPFSAAGIFASNLDQGGTAATGDERPSFSRQDLEAILDRPIIDTGVVYAGIEARSILETYAALGLMGGVDTATLARLESAARAFEAYVPAAQRLDGAVSSSSCS